MQCFKVESGNFDSVLSPKGGRVGGFRMLPGFPAGPRAGKNDDTEANDNNDGD